MYSETNTMTLLRIERLDALLGLVLIVATSLFVLLTTDFMTLPEEDAAILMHYAQNLANGDGIVWNIGEPPVDGATDFLPMVLTAGLMKLGASLEAAPRLLDFISHVLTVLLVYGAVRSLHRANRWLAFFTAAYLMVGPGVRYIEVSFLTPVFALTTALAWFLAYRLTQQYSHRLAVVFSLAALLMGLVRPEGVLVAGSMLLAIIVYRGLRASLGLILIFGGVFAVIGGGYFLWRWSYFGYPLPNPFYKKGGGTLYFNSLRQSITNSLRLTLPFVTFPLLGFRSATMVRRTIFILIPAIGYVGMWVLLANDQNFLMRFQYSLLSIMLISWPFFISNLERDWQLPRLSVLSFANRMTLTMLVLALASGALFYNIDQSRQNRQSALETVGYYDVATILNEFEGRGYTAAVSEAGLLPLYSGWNTIDTWGLNDQWIAHNGGITTDYLAQYTPEVIMFHAPEYSPLVEAYGGNPWLDMTLVLKQYAEDNHYILAGAFGVSPYQAHYYYVRPDFPDSANIAARISAVEYTWFKGDMPGFNFAAVTEQRATGAES